MNLMLFTLSCGLLLVAPIQAGESCQAPFDVVKPRVLDRLCRVTLNEQELDGEIDRRIQNLIYRNYMVVDLDGKWLNHFLLMPRADVGRFTAARTVGCCPPLRPAM